MLIASFYYSIVIAQYPSKYHFCVEMVYCINLIYLQHSCLLSVSKPKAVVWRTAAGDPGRVAGIA